ncbi:MAG: AAA family ATPase [Oenococcus sp.]|uniref:ATP-dependent nuclease n=1 Tax=Oenococcus sp. TaxID=1979414 RepID=UPI0039E76079
MKSGKRMYIEQMRIKNFRQFGPEGCTIPFQKNVTVLVGENDAGKTAIIDALRYATGTTDMRWIRVNPGDVYQENNHLQIEIQLKYTDLSADEESQLLEYLTYEAGEAIVYFNWICKFNHNYVPARTIVATVSGKLADGMPFTAETRELFRVTYLKPLRDAYSDMQSGRNSRLSQIIQQIPDINLGEDNPNVADNNLNLSLIGIFDLINSLLQHYRPLQDTNTEIENILTDSMLLSGENVLTHFRVSDSGGSDKQKVTALLEKISLDIDKQETELYGQPGLGTSNVMSMACELLLSKKVPKMSQFLLIEEPEAHVHPQRQLKLMRSLEKEAEGQQHQIIITTHSLNIASAAHLKDIVLVKDGKVFSMDEPYTCLSHDDYAFLERYLDVTKSNLFFARNIIIVEGSAEELLLPVIADLIGKNLTNFGVSIVNVMGKGLGRYANILARKKSDERIGINVSCVTDRDVEPDCAPHILGQEDLLIDDRHWKRESDFKDDSNKLDEFLAFKDVNKDAENIQTFVSDEWTLEYDIALKSWDDQILHKLMIEALARTNKPIQYTKDPEKTISAYDEKFLKYDSNEEKATALYKEIRGNKGMFAQQLAFKLIENKVFLDPDKVREYMPEYLIKAIGFVTK